jgi:hypothetical protein
VLELLVERRPWSEIGGALKVGELLLRIGFGRRRPELPACLCPRRELASGGASAAPPAPLPRPCGKVASGKGRWRPAREGGAGKRAVGCGVADMPAADEQEEDANLISSANLQIGPLVEWKFVINP